MKKKLPIWVYVLAGFSIYALLTFLLGLGEMLEAENMFISFLLCMPTLWYVKLPIMGFALYGMYVFFLPKLDIKDDIVGHGQHGDARFMTDEEADEIYPVVQQGKETDSGFIVNVEQNNDWRIDKSDNNLLLISPPGGGKTAGMYVPTMTYNARVNLNTGGNGVSMLAVDMKGTLYDTVAPELQRCGYRTPILDLREAFKSYRYNILNDVNLAMDVYKTAGSKKRKAMFYGKAERYAKIAGAAIVDSDSGKVQSEGSEYFTETAKGLIIGLILMVSAYGEDDTRHILSVFELVADLGVRFDGADEKGQTELSKLIDEISNKRIRNYTAGSTSADVRTILNIASSALAKMVKFVDMEFEQIICGQSPELSAEEFIKTPTVLFLICPDENPTRHFLASLFIRTLTNNLIDMAETQYGGTLPRKFLYLIDEFGNMPPIQHVVSIFSAIRSRGGRVMIALQSLAQLRYSYSKEVSDIIRDTCQMTMFSFVAPTSEETATSLSKMLGNETILSGSSSLSKGISTSSRQMVGRPLISPDQLVTLHRWVFITMKGGCHAYKGELKGYWKYLELAKTLMHPVPELPYQDIVTTSAKEILFAAKGFSYKVEKGMFD